MFKQQFQLMASEKGQELTSKVQLLQRMRVKYGLGIIKTIATRIVTPRKAIKCELSDARIQIKDQEVTYRN